MRGRSLEEKLEALRHVGNIGREVGGQWDIGNVLRFDRNNVSQNYPLTVCTKLMSVDWNRIWSCKDQGNGSRVCFRRNLHAIWITSRSSSIPHTTAAISEPSVPGSRVEGEDRVSAVEHREGVQRRCPATIDHISAIITSIMQHNPIQLSSSWSRPSPLMQLSSQCDPASVRNRTLSRLRGLHDRSLTAGGLVENTAIIGTVCLTPKTFKLSDTDMLHMHLHLTNDKLLLIVVESVLGDLQVEGSRTSSNSTRDIVMGTVTGAEPSSVISSLSNRYTTQVGATCQY